MERHLDLYSLLRKHTDYHRLIPKHTELRALALLYTRFGAGTDPGQGFREDDIREALHEAERDSSVETESKREPQERYARVIRDWLHHILSMVPSEKRYIFTNYGLTLFRNIQNELSEEVDPASVAYTLTALVRSLRDTNADTFAQWEREELPGKYARLNQQLRTFEENIRKTLRRLRTSGQAENEFLETVRQVDAALSVLRAQAQELGQAFGQVDELTDYIITLWDDAPTEPDAAAAFATSADSAKQLLTTARRQLSQLRDRLEKAQPRVRELFGNLRKLHFDRKSEVFLLYILGAEHEGLPTNQVHLPAHIPLKPAGVGPFTFRRLQAHSRLFPVARTVAPPRVYSSSHAEATRQQAQDQVLVGQQVAKWLAVIIKEMEMQPEIAFAPIANALALDQPQWAYPILARLLARLIRQEAPARGWQLTVESSEEDTISTPTIWLSLWKLRISHQPTLSIS